MALDYLVLFGGPDRLCYRIYAYETCNKKVDIICIYSYIYIYIYCVYMPKYTY
jgi:hypothetical protein